MGNRQAGCRTAPGAGSPIGVVRSTGHSAVRSTGHPASVATRRCHVTVRNRPSALQGRQARRLPIVRPALPPPGSSVPRRVPVSGCPVCGPWAVPVRQSLPRRAPKSGVNVASVDTADDVRLGCDGRVVVGSGEPQWRGTGTRREADAAGGVGVAEWSVTLSRVVVHWFVPSPDFVGPGVVRRSDRCVARRSRFAQELPALGPGPPVLHVQKEIGCRTFLG